MGYSLSQSLSPPAMENDEAREYLQSLINKNMRILTTDGRMFRGAFKCTDPDVNVVLAQTYEYRQPSARQIARAAEEKKQQQQTEDSPSSSGSSVTLDMMSRYLGLVVVPGHHIVKMEVEEFASQMKATASLV